MLLPLLLLFALWATPTFAQWANEPSGATRVLNCPMSAALTAYTVTPRLTVTATQAGGGM